MDKQLSDVESAEICGSGWADLFLREHAVNF